ncbi:MAG: aconitate hydratase [Ectothiorhodospiraceae bacterium]|nr:aconitate hydratase [Ectothiorhodospiraceae bacterium]
MAMNVAQKLIRDHLVEGSPQPGNEIGLKIDQTLTQDATGTLVMLELEAMELDRVKTEVSVQYVDHNLIQSDFKNPDDHLFLRSACERFGVWYSKPGNGVSHPLHMERFGKPGKTLLGSDSHTCAAGSLGMLAFGAGGIEVAMAMAGKPFFVKMPKVMGVKLTGRLPDWVSAKDVILEMLRRHDVDGGLGKIIEYYGPGLESLSAMDRHVIANMGAELGATTTVFPSDKRVKEFLRQQQRVDDWQELLADEGAEYDEHDEIALDELEPLIAKPGSPGNVVPVREIEGEEIYQTYIGSSANPGLRDFSIVAKIVDSKQTHDSVSFDINPTSRQILETLSSRSDLSSLISAGARIHQAGCNGCIGMGQAPASGRKSLRTVPRNFPGRSGTKDDEVYLCSPETAAASALTGKITDPRSLDMEYPKFEEPNWVKVNMEMFHAPDKNGSQKLEKGPNVASLPELDAIADSITCKVAISLGDDVSTDEILPAGSRVLPYRSNIPKISEFTFYQVDPEFHSRMTSMNGTAGAIVAGENYGQGSSREHAALAPRYLGVRVVLAKSFARIHWQNLVNFGVLPLTFDDPGDRDDIEQGDILKLSDIRTSIERSEPVEIENETKQSKFSASLDISNRQKEVLLAGGLIQQVKEELAS